MVLSPKQATALAILTNELVSNAAKHGRGEVTIALRRAGNSGCLEVSDEGAGFSPDFDPVQAANTGLELIESIGRWDMQGEVRYENRPEGGALISVLFPLTDGRPPRSATRSRIND